MHATAHNVVAYQDDADAYDVENEGRARTMLRKAAVIAPYITANHRSDALGCGTRLFTKLLAGYLPRARITASDAFAPMLEIARDRLSAFSNIALVQYDVETAGPFAEPFDFVCGVDLIHHLNRPVQAMLCWRKIVKPSGRVVFFESNAWNPVLRLRMLNRPQEARYKFNMQANLTGSMREAGWSGVMVEYTPTLSSERPAILMADDQPNRDGGSQADRAATDRGRHDRFGESHLMGLSARDRNFANTIPPSKLIRHV
jgi:SAM-dependent methyltransferase